MKNQNLVAHFSSEIWELLSLAVPIVLSRIGIFLMIFIDSIMSGHISGNDLAYYGLAAIFFVSFNSPFSTMLRSILVIVPKKRIEEGTEGCVSVYFSSILLTIAFSILIFPVFFYGNFVLEAMGHTFEISQGTGEVLRYLSYGVLSYFLFTATSYFLESMGKQNLVTVSLVIGNVLNIILNFYCLHSDAFNSANYIALSTTWVRWFMFLFLLGFALKFFNKNFYCDLIKNTKRILKLGFPMSISGVLLYIMYFYMATFAGWISVNSLAVYEIATNLISLFIMIAMGIAAAMKIKISSAIVTRNQPEIFRLIFVSSTMLLLMMGCIQGIFYLFSNEIAALYTVDRHIQQLAAPIIVFCGLVLIFYSAQFLVIAILTAFEKVWLVTVASLIFLVALTIPLAYMMGIFYQKDVWEILFAMMVGFILMTLTLSYKTFRMFKTDYLKSLQLA